MRWQIELEGNSFDLEEFPRWFPVGEIHAIVVDKKTFITGTHFDKFSDATDVRQACESILTELFAAISLLEGSVRRPSVGDIIERPDNGSRKITCLVVERITFRDKAYANLTTSPREGVQGRENADESTQAQRLVKAAQRHERLQIASSLLSMSGVSWVHLYRTLEEIEAHLGSKVHEAQPIVATKGERDKFTRSANCAEVAGAGARHAAGKYAPPAQPMSLAEGKEFMRRVLLEVLNGVNFVQ